MSATAALMTAIIVSGQPSSTSVSLDQTMGPSQKEVALSQPGEGYKTGRVKYVVDGDTMVLTARGVDFRVRLLAVDTPESVHPDARRNTLQGKMASLFTRKLVDGEEVEYQCRERDHYGRYLCSVSVNGQDVGQSLIASGYSDYVVCWGEHEWLHEEYLAVAGKAVCDRW